jgi:DNA repair protein RecN (Recombination protein N)
VTRDGDRWLIELAVRDLGLIDRVRLELGPGLNVITGETGAGKSLLIDALGLALMLGGREVGATSLAGAEELLQRVAAWRRESAIDDAPSIDDGPAVPAHVR